MKVIIEKIKFALWWRFKATKQKQLSWELLNKEQPNVIHYTKVEERIVDRERLSVTGKHYETKRLKYDKEKHYLELFFSTGGTTLGQLLRAGHWANTKNRSLLEISLHHHYFVIEMSDRAKELLWDDSLLSYQSADLFYQWLIEPLKRYGALAPDKLHVTSNTNETMRTALQVLTMVKSSSVDIDKQLGRIQTDRWEKIMIQFENPFGIIGKRFDEKIMSFKRLREIRKTFDVLLGKS